MSPGARGTVAVLLALLLALVVLPGRAAAEGPLSGGTRLYLEQERVGPFELSSYAAPNPPRTTDNLWITVQVRDGARAVDDARIFVEITPQGGAPVRYEATHEIAPRPYDYTMFAPVPQSGRYTVAIELSHPRGGGTVSYDVGVSEPLTRVILPMMAIPFGLVALWLLHRFWAARGALQSGPVLDEPLAGRKVES